MPGSFKTGDIVEIQLSFVGIATGQGDIKVTSRLQAVTVLDNSFTKVRLDCTFIADISVVINFPSRPPLKHGQRPSWKSKEHSGSTQSGLFF